ncbi:MAG: HAMP domain-containing histidine kinase [Candidatus Eisenbacteria bacterium]|uniref:histidine kinase n=1 Tax=Eiseniibacteriota bacterium TaxID=2212470 RepID=A0A956N9X1_UNCEI|nr:HAMP domain-containing histidine kinase [Candidatus Eisenbacteria bacterium]
MRAALLWSRTRALQICMFLLLVICFAQVLWWFVDQRMFTAEVTEDALAHYQVDVQAAAELLATGTSASEIEMRFPHLDVANGHAIVDPAIVDGLSHSERQRVRRYAWEGGFFLAVLAMAMWILWQTIRREADLRLRQQNFIAAVSHELKSPLASLRLTAETMSLRGPADPERRATLVARMLSDTERLDDMIHKLLDASRLERGKIELHPEPVALGHIVSEAARELKERASERKVEIEIDVPHELEVLADPVAARTVVRNLLENAIQATAAGGGGRVTLNAHRTQDGVHLEVKDTGIGFPPNEAKRIFDKFYRPGDEMRRQVRTAGTGLGLYIVEKLMSGRVRAMSLGPGQGATFDVWWPEAGEDV